MKDNIYLYRITRLYRSSRTSNFKSSSENVKADECSMKLMFPGTYTLHSTVAVNDNVHSS